MKVRRSFLSAVFTVFALAGCTIAPTKVGERAERREFDLVIDKTSKPVEIGENTIVLDARSAFEYGLNHVQNSIHFPWQSLAENSARGEMVRDRRKAGLRLSLIGVHPYSPVLVVGNGLKGNGEEGQMAWALVYLGIQDVQVSANEPLREFWTPSPTPQPQNVPVWPVNPRENLLIGAEEFRELALDVKGRLEKKIWLLDVRSPEEYARKQRPNPKTLPDFGAMNVEWREFYTDKGRPSPAIRKRLEALGVGAGDRIITFSNGDARSGAAAYALLALGFSRVQNFAEGVEALRKLK